MSEGKVILTMYSNPDYLPGNQVDQVIEGVLVVEPPTSSQNVQTGTDLVLLLDSSGSMNEAYYDVGMSKRQKVVEAVRSLLPLMSDLDTLTFISFNTGATLLLDHERRSASTRIETCLQEYMGQDGGTNFEAAMQVASTVCQNRVNPVTRLIFLTDGHAYGGNPQRAVEIAGRMASQGIMIDSMGIGAEFNFDYMRQFSALCAGITENLAREANPQVIFRNILRSGQRTIAANLQLQVFFGNHVRDVEIYQCAPEKRSLSASSTTSAHGTFYQMLIGDLSMGNPKQFVMRCHADLPDASYVKLADILVTYRDPATGNPGKMEIAWTINLSKDDKNVRYDSFVRDCLREVELLIGLEQALRLYQNGNIAECLKKMDGLIKDARSLGDVEQERMLRKAFEKVQRNENLSQEELNRMLHRSSRSSRVRTTQPKNTSTL